MKQANHGAIDNQQLLSIIERIEKLNEDTAAIAADIKEIIKHADFYKFSCFQKQIYTIEHIVSYAIFSNLHNWIKCIAKTS